MVEKVNINNTNEEIKRFVDYINSKKITALILSLLCAALMMVEMVINGFVNMFSVIIGSFIFTSIVHIYVLFKLNLYQINLSNILSATSNNMTIKEWENIEMNQIKERELKVIKLHWRSLVKEYAMVSISCFICMGVVFLSVILPFMSK